MAVGLHIARVLAGVALGLSGCALVGYEPTAVVGGDAGVPAVPSVGQAFGGAAEPGREPVDANGSQEPMDANDTQDPVNLDGGADVDRDAGTAGADRGQAGADAGGREADAGRDAGVGDEPVDPAPDPGGSDFPTSGDALAADVCESADVCLPCLRASTCNSRCGASVASCGIDCASTNTCNVDCHSGATCRADCTEANTCAGLCREGSRCEITCRGVNNCSVDCAEGARCIYDCRDANNCDQVDCREGAECLVLCAGANNCAFHSCWAGAQTCPDGQHIACGAVCP